MRIAMLADMYKPHVSGVTHHIELNKREFERLGHEVFVFTFGNLDHADDEANIVRSFGIPYGDTGYNLGLGYGARARDLLRTMDVVHVHHPFVSGRLALALCKPAGIPVVFTNHTRYDYYADTYVKAVPKSVRDAFVKRSLGSFFRDVDLAISPSEGMVRVLRGLGIDSPVEVVPNGVDVAPFSSAVPADREGLGLAPDDVVFGFLGRLGIEKGVDVLLRAFASAAADVGGLRLLLIGDGPDRARLESLAGDLGVGRAAVFAGMVPYDRVPSYVRACDALASASVTEVHPLTVIEAMAAGLPIAGMASVGVSDTVRDGVDGFLAASPEELATAIARLGADPSLRGRMAEEAARRAASFDIRRTAGLLLERYESLLARV